MALDKLVDSTQLDADLTSVANAIRTKGGTSTSLAFPAGFVQAIADIPSGGGGGSSYVVSAISMDTFEVYYIDENGTFHNDSPTPDMDTGTLVWSGALMENTLVVFSQVVMSSSYPFSVGVTNAVRVHSETVTGRPTATYFVFFKVGASQQSL